MKYELLALTIMILCTAGLQAVTIGIMDTTQVPINPNAWTCKSGTNIPEQARIPMAGWPDQSSAEKVCGKGNAAQFSSLL